MKKLSELERQFRVTILKMNMQRHLLYGEILLWGFCVFGLNSGKQIFGRGLSSTTSMKKMAVLDFSKLTKQQINEFNKIFDEYKECPLLEMKKICEDETRKKIDDGILKILKIDHSIDDIRTRLSNEPSFNGGDKEKVISQQGLF